MLPWLCWQSMELPQDWHECDILILPLFLLSQGTRNCSSTPCDCPPGNCLSPKRQLLPIPASTDQSLSIHTSPQAHLPLSLAASDCFSPQLHKHPLKCSPNAPHWASPRCCSSGDILCPPFSCFPWQCEHLGTSEEERKGQKNIPQLEVVVFLQFFCPSCKSRMSFYFHWTFFWKLCLEGD